MRSVRTACWILCALAGGFLRPSRASSAAPPSPPRALSRASFGAPPASLAGPPASSAGPPASALDTPAPPSLGEPAGKKHTLESEHFEFIYDPDKVIDVATVQQSAEAAYRRLSDLLQFNPKDRIPVVLYANRAEFRAAAHVSRTELVVGVASSADEAIRLDASKIFDSPDRVIGHEVTHIFLFQMLKNNIGDMPLWMNEGLAQEAGGADGDAAHARVVDALLANRLISLRNLALEFPKGEDAGLAYDEAQEAVHVLLTERGGWPAMRDLLDRLQDGDSYDDAFQAVYGMSNADWDNRWQNMVRVGARSQFWIQVAEWLVPALMFLALAWGVYTVRRHRMRQIREETPEPDMEPPAWWREDDFKWR